MMSTLSLYLDQRDLSDLSNEQNPTAKMKLEELLSSRRVRIVLSFMHVIETWKHADRMKKQRIAAYTDSLSPVWIINRDYLFREEIRRALGEYSAKHHDGCNQYRLCPFRKSITEAIGEEFNRMNQQKTSGNLNLPKSFIDMLNMFENDPKLPQMLTEIHQAYPEVIRSSREKNKGSIGGRIKFLECLVSEADSIPILCNSKVADHFLRWLDINIKKCPALYCYLRIKDEINKDKLSTPHPSEMVDIIHITALPYCDAFSTDKRIRDYIRRCRLEKSSFEMGRTRAMRAFKLLTDAIDWIELSYYADS